MMILYWLLVVLMLVGIIGAVIPGIPGSSLILTAIVVWGVVNGFNGVGVALAVGIAVLVLSTLIDFLAGYLGAQKAGASHWGQIGAFVGLVLGFLGLLPALPVGGPLLGILLGPFVGAVMAEFIYRRDLRVAAKAGVGIVVGSLVGNLMQLILAIMAVGVFLWTTWPWAATPA